MTTRTFGDYTFECVRAGQWIAQCPVGTAGIYRMMAGTRFQQWEVYSSTSPDPLDGNLVGTGLTMAEAVCEAFGLALDEVHRANGIASSRRERKGPA